MSPSLIKIVQGFKDNLQGFWSEHFWLIVLFTVSIAADCATTIFFMLRDGFGNELHPMFRYAAAQFGCVVGPTLAALVKVALGILVCIHLRKFAAVIFLTTSCVSVWAALHNLGGPDHTLFVHIFALVTTF